MVNMVIGITGGVGSGKSTVLQILKDEYNAAIIMSDDVAREIEEPGNACYDKIVSSFGTDVLEGRIYGNRLDRAETARIVFADKSKLELLNSIVHPEVKSEIIRRINSCTKEDPGRLVIIESAILIEAGYREMCDEIWAVIADDEVRAERLMSSRGYTREKTLNIMSNQKSSEEYIAETDFAVDNSGSIESTRKQIKQRLSRN